MIETALTVLPWFLKNRSGLIADDIFKPALGDLFPRRFESRSEDEGEDVVGGHAQRRAGSELQ